MYFLILVNMQVGYNTFGQIQNKQHIAKANTQPIPIVIHYVSDTLYHDVSINIDLSNTEQQKFPIFLNLCNFTDVHTSLSCNQIGSLKKINIVLDDVLSQIGAYKVLLKEQNLILGCRKYLRYFIHCNNFEKLLSTTLARSNNSKLNNLFIGLIYIFS